MQAVQVVMRILNVPQIYTPDMIRNIITTRIQETPWRNAAVTVRVESLGDIPDLTATSALSEQEILRLRELQEELRKQRDDTNDLLEKIANRISAAAREGIE